MTYNEAKDHCENMNGTLIKEQRIEDVYNVEIFLPLLNIIFLAPTGALEEGILCVRACVCVCVCPLLSSKEH